MKTLSNISPQFFIKKYNENIPGVRNFFFTSISFENYIFKSDKIIIDKLLNVPFPKVLFQTIVNGNNLFLLINEKSPGLFDVESIMPRGNQMCLVGFNVDCINEKIIKTETTSQEEVETLLQLCELFIDELTHKDIVFGKTKKSKNPLLRNKCKYKNVVFVSKKKYINESQEKIPSLIEWSHKWEVMGHWRRCSTVGKDRDGNYNVIGLTWVSPHIRGEGELVIKTRIVKGEMQCLT